ncbi:MAG TPA: hypothetical protein VGQ64_02755 [Candidatus Limnocylindrales bacterium]|jgi:hypothetical protein|nr:hypothetical protein [Candidatus Limnocylindrales bacterium]
MSDGLPEDLWSYLFRPAPAWPWTIEDGWDPAVPPVPLADRGLVDAARNAFAFLEELGFTLSAADAWDLAEESWTLSWERSDALVLATFALDGSFFVLIAHRPDSDEDNAPSRARIDALLGDQERVAAFGSLPVLGSDASTVAGQVSAYTAVLREHAGRLLADRPIDFAALTAACEAAVESLRRPRLIAYAGQRAEAAWVAERWAAYLEAAAHLEYLGVPPDADRVSIATARRPPPPSLGDADMEEPARTERAIALVQAARARLDKAVADRFRGAAERARWEDAAREWRDALALVYPPDFDDKLERLRAGKPDGVEMGIRFLEIDPWSFRTGYAKETILHFLKRAPLDEDQARRLRAVVRHAVDVGDRREFRGYCKVARRVADDGLRSDLLTRLRSSDRGVARRALWVLDAVGDSLGPDHRATAQAVIERSADDPQWWRSSGWIRRDVQRYGDQLWFDRLLERALTPGHAQNTALRLLTSFRIHPTQPQREMLATLVLEAVKSDEDNDWIEGITASADHPAFREALIAAYLSASDDDERRLTWWAINAIRRTADDGWPGDLLDR